MTDSGPSLPLLSYGYLSVVRSRVILDFKTAVVRSSNMFVSGTPVLLYVRGLSIRIAAPRPQTHPAMFMRIGRLVSSFDLAMITVEIVFVACGACGAFVARSSHVTKKKKKMSPPPLYPPQLFIQVHSVAANRIVRFPDDSSSQFSLFSLARYPTARR